MEEKPWRMKKHKFKAQVQIFESKPVFSRSDANIASFSKFITIIGDGESTFVLPLEIIKSCSLIQVLFGEDDDFLKGKPLENSLRIPFIQGEVLEVILRYLYMEYNITLKENFYFGQNSARSIFQFEIDPSMVLKIISVAHYLGHKNLFEFCSTMLAHTLNESHDLSVLPVEIVSSILKKMSPDELFFAEERADFQSFQLDTEEIWKSYCNCFVSEIIQPRNKSIESDYSTWEQHPPPPSWKSCYLTNKIQSLADTQQTTNDVFLKEIKNKGRFVYKHHVYYNLYDMFKAHDFNGLIEYLEHFPELNALFFSKSDLETRKGFAKSLREVLNFLPKLEILNASEFFLPIVIRGLSNSLEHQHNLQVLVLSSCFLSTDDFSKLILSLPSSKLKSLDVSHNAIKNCVAENVSLSLQACCLEELILDGNPLGKAADHMQTQPKFNDSIDLNDGRKIPGTSRGSERKTEIERIRSKVEINQVNESRQGDENLEGNGQGNGKDSIRSRERRISRTTEGNGKSEKNFVYCSLLSRIPYTLKRLFLKGCHLADCQLVTLVKALTHHQNIRDLDLSDNDICGFAADSIFSWLPTCESIQRIDFSKNAIMSINADSFSLSLSSHPTLNCLSFAFNYSFSDVCLVQVMDAAAACATSRNRQFHIDVRSIGISNAARDNILMRYQDNPHFVLTI